MTPDVVEQPVAHAGAPVVPARARTDWSGVVDRLHLPTLGVAIGLALVWVMLSARLGDYLLPSPARVGQGILAVITSGELWKHTWASLYRISVGFGLAVLVSIVFASLVAMSRHVATIGRDLTAVLNSTSVFVWIVVSLIWFGLTDKAAMFTTFMITLPVLLANMLEGVANVDRKLIEMAQVYRFSPLDRFLNVTLPSTIPYLVAGMKVGFGLGLKVSVVAEIFGVSTGIGYMMNYSRDTLRTDMVFVWALVLIVIMLVVDKLVFDSLSRRVAAWR
ncbi:MAG TPA: ABC transporter permease [Chloroflexota bacterium]|nr:ABC transporter permease [Chloroflexota bacterium]